QPRTTEIYPLSLHDALPILLAVDGFSSRVGQRRGRRRRRGGGRRRGRGRNVVGRRLVGRDELGPAHAGQDLVEQRGSRRLPAATRLARVPVFVLVLAGGAPGQTAGVLDDRDDGVIGDPPLAWTVIVHDVAEPQRTLLHSTLPTELHSRYSSRTLARAFQRAHVRQRDFQGRI